MLDRIFQECSRKCNSWASSQIRVKMVRGKELWNSGNNVKWKLDKPWQRVCIVSRQVELNEIINDWQWDWASNGEKIWCSQSWY